MQETNLFGKECDRMPSQPVHAQNYQAVSRIGYIDFLKVIGLAGIVAAHTGPPGWVIMLRCFDVPLMVILSAMLGRGLTAGGWKPESRFRATICPG